MNQIDTNQMRNANENPAPRTGNDAGDALELFAEELPAQQDLRTGSTSGCIATAACATGGGSTFSTLSSFSSL